MAEDWAADVKKYAPKADDNVIAGIVRYCGIALTKRDSSLVAFSDSKETDRVRNNFLKKKLARTEADSVLDAAIAAVGEVMKADRTKNRVTVYYLLADKFDSLGLFLKSSNAKPKAPAKATGAAAEKKPAAKAAPKTTATAPAPKAKASGAGTAAAAGGAALGLAAMGSGNPDKAKVDTSTPSPAAASAANDTGLGAKGAAALGAAGAAVTGAAATLASGAASAADKAGDTIGDAAAAAADTAGKAGAAVVGAAGAAATGAAALAGKAGDAVGGAASSAVGAASSLVGGDDEGSSNWLWWLLLGLLALFALWWFFLRGPADTDAAPVAATTEAATVASTGASDASADLSAAPAEGSVTIPTGAGVTSELRDGKPVVKVYFDTAKTDVAAAFTGAAGGLKAWLDSHPGSTLAVSGFADPTGNAARNAELSKQRAQAVQAALVAAGIPEASAELVKPDDSTDATVDKAAARRVEVVVR